MLRPFHPEHSQYWELCKAQYYNGDQYIIVECTWRGHAIARSPASWGNYLGKHLQQLV